MSDRTRDKYPPFLFPIADLKRRIDQLERELAAAQKDAERYRCLRRILHGAKAGGGVEVNDALQVYEQPEPGEEVRIYWYQDTPVGFYHVFGSTLDEAIDAIAQAKPEKEGK